MVVLAFPKILLIIGKFQKNQLVWQPTNSWDGSTSLSIISEELVSMVVEPIVPNPSPYSNFRRTSQYGSLVPLLLCRRAFSYFRRTSQYGSQDSKNRSEDYQQGFQKNQLVWQPFFHSAGSYRHDPNISEELVSMVAQCQLCNSMLPFFTFQKNQLVWQQTVGRDTFRAVAISFQKNQLVWQQPRMSSIVQNNSLFQKNQLVWQYFPLFCLLVYFFISEELVSMVAIHTSCVSQPRSSISEELVSMVVPDCGHKGNRLYQHFRRTSQYGS